MSKPYIHQTVRDGPVGIQTRNWTKKQFGGIKITG